MMAILMKKSVEEGENGSLHETDEDLERHDGYRSYERNEVGHDEDQDLSCENVAEQTE